jgi:hypothetical protein
MLAKVGEQLGVVPELLLEPGAIFVSNSYLGLPGRLLRVTHSVEGTRLATCTTPAVPAGPGPGGPRGHRMRRAPRSRSRAGGCQPPARNATML